MITGTIPYKKFNFPTGEMHVVLDIPPMTTYYPPRIHEIQPVDIHWTFERNDEIVEILLYNNALREHSYKLSQLTIPYFPFSRQDRVASTGDSFSLKVMCDVVNMLGADHVITYDAHSDVLLPLVKNLYHVTQDEIFHPIINSLGVPVSLISPDGGALKKIYKLAKRILSPVEVIECSKKRDPQTGEITGTHIYADKGHLDGRVCVIVDDICDGGRTFIEIAKEIRANNSPQKIILMVTHGFFTKGLSVFHNLIDEIYTGSTGSTGYRRKLITSDNHDAQSLMERRAV